MRKIGILFAAVALLAPAVIAQTIHDDIAFARAHIQADRQTVVAETLKLNDEQAKVFWPVYRQYRTDLAVPLDRLWNLFVTYGEKWDSLNDADASKLLDEYLKIESDTIQIKQKYAKQMTQKLGGVTTARFFQIDNKLDSILRLEAASEIPLVTQKQ